MKVVGLAPRFAARPAAAPPRLGACPVPGVVGGDHACPRTKTRPAGPSRARREQSGKPCAWTLKVSRPAEPLVRPPAAPRAPTARGQLRAPDRPHLGAAYSTAGARSTAPPRVGLTHYLEPNPPHTRPTGLAKVSCHTPPFLFRKATRDAPRGRPSPPITPRGMSCSPPAAVRSAPARPPRILLPRGPGPGSPSSERVGAVLFRPDAADGKPPVRPAVGRRDRPSPRRLGRAVGRQLRGRLQSGRAPVGHLVCR